MVKPEISVIIPAYNEEKYLARCLESLKKQTFPKDKYEIIVVDNNSTDKTRQIAESFGVKIVNCDIQGVSAARDVGCRAADGVILVGTDADTIVKQDWLEKIYTHFDKDPNLIGLTGPAGLVDNNWLVAKTGYFMFDIFQRFNFLIKHPSFSGFNFAVKKEAYLRAGGFDPRIVSAEDIDLSLRLAKIGKVAYFADVVAYTSARRLNRNPIKFFRHNLKNYIAMLRGKEPEPFEPIR